MIYIGEGACAATYWTKTYRGLYICRALTGFSLGGATPLIYSLLGDLYPAEQRIGVNSLVFTGIGFGVTIGQGVAGYLGPKFGWRLPFLVVSIPALITATLVGLLVHEPIRGSRESVIMSMREHETSQYLKGTREQQQNLGEEEKDNMLDYLNKNTKIRFSAGERKEEKNSVLYHHQGEPLNSAGNFRLIKWAKNVCISISKTVQSTIILLKTKSVLLLVLQGVPGCIPWGIVNTFLNDYLSQNQGMSIAGATTTTLFFGFGVFLGIVASAMCGKHLYTLSPIYPVLLAGSTAILGCIPFWMLLNYVTVSTALPLAMLISVSAGLGIGVAGPIVKATLTNVTEPLQRSQAFALAGIFNDLGVGLGPLFIANLIAFFDGNRRKAFNIGVSGWIVCGIINALVSFTVTEDEREVQKRVLANLRPTTFHQIELGAIDETDQP